MSKLVHFTLRAAVLVTPAYAVAAPCTPPRSDGGSLAHASSTATEGGVFTAGQSAGGREPARAAITDAGANAPGASSPAPALSRTLSTSLSTPLPVDSMATQLGYTLDELALNRSCVVSRAQARASVEAAVPMVVLALATLGILAVVSVLVKPAGVRRIWFGLLSFGGVAVGLSLAWSTVYAAIERRVLVAEGQLAFTSGYRQSVSVIVGDFRGPVHNAHSAFLAGARYRVYYLAHSGDFLSAEPLDPSP